MGAVPVQIMTATMTHGLIRLGVFGAAKKICGPVGVGAKFEIMPSRADRSEREESYSSTW
jgi:hypothetical protein